MEIEILHSAENELEFRLTGEEDTFANLLRKMLHEDSHVTFAAYRVNHPLTERKRPVFKVKTNGNKSPKQALEEAAERIKETAEEFKDCTVDKV